MPMKPNSGSLARKVANMANNDAIGIAGARPIGQRDVSHTCCMLAVTSDHQLRSFIECWRNDVDSSVRGSHVDRTLAAFAD
jgi:hypothetical protein